MSANRQKSQSHLEMLYGTDPMVNRTFNLIKQGLEAIKEDENSVSQELRLSIYGHSIQLAYAIAGDLADDKARNNVRLAKKVLIDIGGGIAFYLSLILSHMLPEGTPKHDPKSNWVYRLGAVKALLVLYEAKEVSNAVVWQQYSILNIGLSDEERIVRLACIQTITAIGRPDKDILTSLIDIATSSAKDEMLAQEALKAITSLAITPINLIVGMVQTNIPSKDKEDMKELLAYAILDIFDAAMERLGDIRSTGIKVLKWQGE